ncbi:MAG: hypothetical protein K6C94_09005 [Candidatus Gastranaerophilales bacterium]|nr:hypothetical protein [Candidatus Gastranaerophilales bacterium]
MNADITMPENTINATFKLEVIPDISVFATKAEVAEVENQIPDISGLATKSEVSAVESEIPDVSGLATKQEVSAVEAQIPTVPVNVSAFTNDANYVNNNVLQQNLLLSNALITGSVSDNAVVYADIISRYRSSFDITNFTVVGSPTITGGIAGGFSGSNYLTFSAVQLGNYTTWQIDIEFTTGASVSGDQRILNISRNLYYNGSQILLSNGNLMIVIASNTGNATSDIVFYSATAEANKKYRISIENTGTAYVGNVNGTEVFNETSSAVCGTSLNSFVIGQINNTSGFGGSVDLTKFVIYGSGNVLVSGMVRGSDTYTIGGNTVTIPYTVTKNGAKIVDSAHRTAVQSVYNATGSALYYTLDEENQDFTLPAGDLYGILQKLSDRITALET